MLKLLLHNHIKLLLSQTHSLFPLEYIFLYIFPRKLSKNCKKPHGFHAFMHSFLDIK